MSDLVNFCQVWAPMTFSTSTKMGQNLQDLIGLKKPDDQNQYLQMIQNFNFLSSHCWISMFCYLNNWGVKSHRAELRKEKKMNDLWHLSNFRLTGHTWRKAALGSMQLLKSSLLTALASELCQLWDPTTDLITIVSGLNNTDQHPCEHRHHLL